MFNNPKYLTRGIDDKVPLDIQIIIWSLIDEMGKIKQLDYLQIFELKPVIIQDKPMLQITYRQEKPEFKVTRWFRVSETINLTIWIIDSVKYSTMLLPDEY